MEDKPKRSAVWDGACTIEECILKMILEGKGKTKEFEILCKPFGGRERALKVWKDYQDKQGGKK